MLCNELKIEDEFYYIYQNVWYFFKQYRMQRFIIFVKFYEIVGYVKQYNVKNFLKLKKKFMSLFFFLYMLIFIYFVYFIKLSMNL